METFSTPSTPIYEHVPPPPLNRRLWSSPSFSHSSDYYSASDSGAFSPDEPFHKLTFGSLGNQPLVRPDSQNQRIILDRLNGIAKAILASPDLTEHHFQLIEQDVDRLEETIAAPDPQSREPADGNGDLFADDDEDDLTEVATEGDAGEAEAVAQEAMIDTRECEETDAMIARVVQVADDLKRQFLDMKVNLEP
jgi:hypothetical protein